MFMVYPINWWHQSVSRSFSFFNHKGTRIQINLPSVPTPSIPSQKTKIHQQSHSWAISAPEASDCQKRCLCPVIHTSFFCTTSESALRSNHAFFIFGVCPPRMHWKKIFWDYKTPNIICWMINPQIHTGSSFLNGSLVPNRRTQLVFDNKTRLAGKNAIACEDPLPTDPNNPKISVANVFSCAAWWEPDFGRHCPAHLGKSGSSSVSIILYWVIFQSKLSTKVQQKLQAQHSLPPSLSKKFLHREKSCLPSHLKTRHIQLTDQIPILHRSGTNSCPKFEWKGTLFWFHHCHLHLKSVPTSE